MASVTLKNIYKKYLKGQEAAKDVSFTAEDGEFVVLVGPSGCGKSTILRMIAGLEEITSGDLYFNDVRVNDMHPRNRDVGMVFQNYALYPHLTVYENIAFPLSIRRERKNVIKERVNEIAQMIGMQDYLKRRPKELSGGQRQRVALGRAIVRQPQVFLFDEPLSNLDAKLRVQMRAEISNLHRKLGITSIYVTHDQVEAMTMGTRIVVMKDGVVHQVDTPKKLYDKPNNMFVAGFIGSPQMNFIDAEVISNSDGIQLQLQDGVKLSMEPAQESMLSEKGYIGRKIVLGIRPEHLHDKSIDSLSNDYNELKTAVDVTELMGAELYIHANISSTPIVARVSGQSGVRMGDVVFLQFHYDKMHMFDKETELVIR
jgi:multiple sugar transport system ATP-binding protein